MSPCHHPVSLLQIQWMGTNEHDTALSYIQITCRCGGGFTFGSEDGTHGELRQNVSSDPRRPA